MKPTIGIISYPYKDKDNDKEFQVDYNVVSFINKLDAIPITILPTNYDDFLNKRNIELNNLSKEELIKLKEVLSLCDGIIKPGGFSFIPFHYNIYKYTLENNVPYLGICNGMQLMEKSITKDLVLEKINTDINHKDSYHEVVIEKKTKLYKIIGKEVILVRSHHKYKVPNTSTFIVNARSIDGVIEGLEDKNSLFNVGVEWHPEQDIDNEDSIKLFESFIDASKVFKKCRI